MMIVDVVISSSSLVEDYQFLASVADYMKEKGMEK